MGQKLNSKAKHGDEYAWLIFTPILLLVVFLVLWVAGIITTEKICFKILYLVVALSGCALHAVYAFRIHNFNQSEDQYNNWFKYNQYVFNGLGAFLGWFALYIIMFHRIGGDGGWNFAEWNQNLSFTDMTLTFVAFLGISGYIPHVTLLGKKIGL